jgi:hypothetical protein
MQPQVAQEFQLAVAVVQQLLVLQPTQMAALVVAV